MQECHCAPVTAPEMVNVSGLLDMAGRTHRDSVLLSETNIRVSAPAFVKVPREDIRERPSARKNSSHKVLTQNHDLRGY